MVLLREINGTEMYLHKVPKLQVWENFFFVCKVLVYIFISISVEDVPLSRTNPFLTKYILKSVYLSFLRCNQHHFKGISRRSECDKQSHSFRSCFL